MELKGAHLSAGSVLALMVSLCLLFISMPVSAKDGFEKVPQRDGANASDPLAKLNNTDLKWTYLDEGGASTNLWWVKGGYRYAKWGKINYGLTYARTDDAGTITQGWDVLSLKPLFFVGRGKVGSWSYRLATGAELVFDFAEVQTGIGAVRGYGKSGLIKSEPDPYPRTVPTPFWASAKSKTSSKPVARR